MIIQYTEALPGSGGEPQPPPTPSPQTPAPGSPECSSDHPESATGHPASVSDHQTPGIQHRAPDNFPRFPAETPRAFSAFMTFFNLGHTRSLNAVADLLDEQIGTIKKWSSRFRWANRIHAFNSGLLQQQAETEAALRAEQAADWARRTAQFREHEWDTSQKILAAVHCFLDDFSDRHVDKMTLSQVSRALQIASSVGRSALASSPDSGQPPIAPIQIELTAALKKAYSQAPPNHPPPAPVGTNATGNQLPQ